MGFFGSSGKNIAGTLPSISQKRLIKICETDGYSYFIDSDGDLGTFQDANRYYFLISGNQSEILQIIGYWRIDLRMERLEEVRAYIRDHRRLFPRVYHSISDDGRIRVLADLTIDYEHGATDDQLRQHMICACGSSAGFFFDLGEALGV